MSKFITVQSRIGVSEYISKSNDNIHIKSNKINNLSDVNKSKIIESLILNIPLSPVYLYEYEYNKFELIEDYGILDVIKSFTSNEFNLKGLGFFEEFNGLNFSDLPRDTQKYILGKYMPMIILMIDDEVSSDKEELRELAFKYIGGFNND